jgi:hypothetical protein
VLWEVTVGHIASGRLHITEYVFADETSGSTKCETLYRSDDTDCRALVAIEDLPSQVKEPGNGERAYRMKLGSTNQNRGDQQVPIQVEEHCKRRN